MVELHRSIILMRMKRLAIIAGALAVVATAHADLRSSAKYTVTAEATDAAGRLTTSADYSDEGSLGDVFETSDSAVGAVTLKQGFISQLYHAESLTVTAAPLSVVEGMTTQLSSTATLDDGSLINFQTGEVLWSVLDGPITGISLSGLATTGEVFINAPAIVQGSWDGGQGLLTITVLNVSSLTHADPAPELDFTPGTFDAADAGVYQGILSDNDGNVVGAITGFKLMSSRAFTAKVIFNGTTYSLAGSVLADGSFNGEIKRTGKTSLTVSLQIGRTDSGGLTVYGTVTGDGASGAGLIALASEVPAELVKSYTFLVPATTTGNTAIPEGDGYGSAKVSALGVITAAGKTGDGVAFTCGGAVTEDRQWQLFQPLYGSKGQIAGVLTFRDVAGVSDVDGTLRWVKNPNHSDKSYPLGFTVDPSLVGCVYAPPAKGQRALTQLADQQYNARLTLAGTVLPGGGMEKTVSWLTTNAVAYYGPESLAATMTVNTGILTGSYYDPANKVRVAFAGAVLQKQGLACGNFLLNQRAGNVFIEPGTAFPFPGSEGAGPLARVTLPDAPATAPILTPANFSAAAVGSYGGILLDGSKISGGLENVSISTTKVLSGSVVIEGKRYSFKGLLDTDGMATVVIVRTGLPNIVGTLQLALANGTVDGFQLTGNFNADGVLYAIDAQRFAVFTTKAPAPETGNYTLAMRAPDATDIALEPGGDGYARLFMPYTGACYGALTLADGTVTTFAGRVSRNGEWSLHRSLYGTTGGYIAGKLTFRSVDGVSDLDGEWRWVKPNGVPKTPTYPAGFNVTRGVIGCVYTPPIAGQRALATLSGNLYNAWLRFSGPDMSTQPSLDLPMLDRAATWSAANKIFYYGPEKVVITFDAADGIVTGTYTDTARGVNITFGGALLQEQGLLTGRYTADGKSGLFSIVPR